MNLLFPFRINNASQNQATIVTLISDQSTNLFINTATCVHADSAMPDARSSALGLGEPWKHNFYGDLAQRRRDSGIYDGTRPVTWVSETNEF